MAASNQQTDEIAALKFQLSIQEETIRALKASQEPRPPVTTGQRLARYTLNHSTPTSHFDFSQYASRPIALKVAYCGWNLYGLTCQDNDIVETVEFHLFAALINAKLITTQHACRWSRSGRTDKGVSSSGQVVSLFIRSSMKLGSVGTVAFPFDTQESLGCGLAVEDEGFNELPYISMINRFLPTGIRALEWAAVDGAFDSRFSCTHRMYKYYIPSNGLDVDAMNRAAKLYIGDHNFRNFCKIDLQRLLVSCNRTIFEASVYDVSKDPRTNDGFRHEAFHVFCVKGRGFLWHQVRMMTAILILIGKGLETEQLITQLLDINANPRKPNYEMAHELPLVLVECGYDNTIIHWRGDALKAHTDDKTVTSLMGMWREVSTKQAIIAGFIGNQFQDKVVDFQEEMRGKVYVEVMKLSKLRSLEETMSWLMLKPRKRYPFTMVDQAAIKADTDSENVDVLINDIIE